jgi:hypothetical protein
MDVNNNPTYLEQFENHQNTMDQIVALHFPVWQLGNG